MVKLRGLRALRQRIPGPNGLGVLVLGRPGCRQHGEMRASIAGAFERGSGEHAWNNCWRVHVVRFSRTDFGAVDQSHKVSRVADKISTFWEVVEGEFGPAGDRSSRTFLESSHSRAITRCSLPGFFCCLGDSNHEG